MQILVWAIQRRPVSQAVWPGKEIQVVIEQGLTGILLVFSLLFIHFHSGRSFL